MGIDIKPGHSPRSNRPPRYAVVILRDGEVIDKLDNITLYNAIRLIIEYHVDVLAVDNLSEIAKNSRDLARLSKIIPSWCKVVEVTNTGDTYIKTEELAQRLGLGQTNLSPIDTALVVAYAAYKGIGKEVKLTSDRVYIVVSKGRTPTQGGSSTDRFKRSIRASVLQLVKEIKEVLDKNELDYDLVVKESDGGLERGFFIVYAPLEKVREIVSPLDHKNVKIKIKPAYRGKSIRELKRNVIVGIDPGTSIGIAALDLDGNPLFIYSYKNPDREKVIETILAIGKPVIVSVDVAKPPEYAKKIASTLNAILYYPDEDLSVDEKQRLVNEYVASYNVEVPDTHARDALSAAIKAYKQVKPLIEEVESKIRGINGLNRDEVVLQILKGRPLSEVLEEAFMKILTRYESEEQRTRVERRKLTVNTEDVQKLQARIIELENMVKRLEEALRARDELIENLELELRLLRRRPVSEEYDRKINQLQMENESLRKAITEKNSIIEFLRDKIMSLERIIVDTALGKVTIACKSSYVNDCRNLPVYVDNALHIEECIKYAKMYRTGLIVSKEFETLNWDDIRVPIIRADPLLDLGEYVLVEESLVKEIDNMWRKIEEMEANERKERILRMIKEYQESRRDASKV